MCASREFVDARGLMVCGSNVFDLYRRPEALGLTIPPAALARADEVIQ